MVERLQRLGPSLGLLLVALVLSGCGDASVTTVAMTLSTIDESEAEHYELFAVVNGSAVSVRRFEVHAAESGFGSKQVVDHFNPGTVLGVTDGFDEFGRPIGGVRFRTHVDLSPATHLFITRELDGDTDPAPSDAVFASCKLLKAERGTLGCVLVTPDDKSLARGTATLVLPDDGLNPL